MTGLGTIINCAAIIIGGFAGMTVKGGLPERFQKTIMHGVSLAVLFIGISGAVSGLLTLAADKLLGQNTMMMVLSLALGAVVGELIDLDAKLTQLGEWTKAKIPKKIAGARFVEGFVSASILFCVGGMAVVGSLEDALLGNYSTLFAKAILDGITSVVLATSLGFGVVCSAIPVLAYQGLLTLLAQFIEPYLSDVLITQMTCVGSVLIFAIGLNMIFDNSKIKIANLLPAIFFPIIFMLIKSIWPALPI